MARWDELFLEPAAPVLLRGLTITPTRARHDDFDLTLDDEDRGQPGAAAQAGHRVRRGDRGAGGRAGEQVGELLRRGGAAAEVPGFEIIDRQVIGTFTYAKLPMVRDLQAAGELLGDSDVVAAIAGDLEAQELLSATTPADRRRPSRCSTRPSTTTRCWTPTPRSAARSTRCCPGAAW